MEAAADPFSCLANPVRRSVLDALRLHPMCVEDLWSKVEHIKKLSLSSLSEHLAVLRGANMVRVTVERNKRIYALHPDGFAPVFDWVNYYEAFWDDKLANLSTYLDKAHEVSS